jgi:glycosyltransferase involved in cell wall biosynthesis
MVCPRFLPETGGTETHVYEVSRRLPSVGDFEITVLATDRSRRLPREDVIEGIPVLRVPSWPRSGDYYFAPGIWAVISQRRWDLVHCQGIHTPVPLLAMLSAQRAGLPYLVTFHTGGHSSRLRNAMRATQWRLAGPLLRNAASLIAVSQFEAATLTRHARLEDKQVIVIRNGGTLPPLRAETPVVPGRIISAGRLERYKGHHRAIQALPHVIRKIPQAHLLILGTGPYESNLRELARHLGVSDRVTIKYLPSADRQAMATTLAQSSVVAALSDYEAHPVAVMEALSAARPVVGCDIAGIGELIAKGWVRGVPPGARPATIARELINAMYSPSPVDCAQLPSWDSCASQLAHVYLSSLSIPPKTGPRERGARSARLIAMDGGLRTDMNWREHASPDGPSHDVTTRNAVDGTTHTANPPNGTRVARNGQAEHGPLWIVRGRQRGDAHLPRGLEAFVMRRYGHRDRFLAGVVSATTGLGLLGEGLAMAVAPRHPAAGQLLFFVAIVIPFMIFLTVLMVPGLGRLREITVAVLGLYPAVVYRMSSPLVLASYDEHQHQQSLMNLLFGSGLFSSNPVLRVGPFYPGLEIFTGVGIRLTGMPVVLAMSLVVLLCRLLLVLIIYQSALLVSPSRRGASLVVAFYAVSSEFYSFNSAFAYQTLALTLGLGGIYLLRRAQLAGQTTLADQTAARRFFLLASLVLIATVVTHHATSWMVLAFLIAWAAVSRPGERTYPARAAVVMGTACAIWTAALVPRLAEYLGPVFSGVVQTAKAFLAGTSGHQIFGASGATPPAADWERVVLAGYEISCTVAALACSWIMLSRAFHNRDRMLGLLGALNLAFPLTAVAHFNPGVGELGDRAATFLFLPLALSCSLIIQRHPRVIRRPAGGAGAPRNPFRPAVLIALIGVTSVVYLGGILLGSNPDWSRLPGPYLVAADFRSQDSETLAAVNWAAAHLPAGSTVVADRTPAVLLASQARLWPETEPQEGFVPAQLYFSATWGPQQTAIVKALHIDYIYVDTRLADSLPYLGYYISQGETHKPTRITVADVAKFAHVPGLTAVYHHGPVTIYATAGLGVAPVRKGFTGYHAMGLGDFDAILGAAVVLLILQFRRRLAWVAPAARDIGPLGITLAVIAGTIFIGGALFALRLMPGPAFTLGAVVTSVVALAVNRRMNGLWLVPRLHFKRGLDPLIVLGVVTGAAGLAIAIHAAWITDVAAVNAILRAVS